MDCSQRQQVSLADLITDLWRAAQFAPKSPPAATKAVAPEAWLTPCNSGKPTVITPK